jgi:DNA polymerase-3 subunit delta'
VPHAYLLSGESGIPVMETAIFIGKTLLCDNPNPFACEECRTCTRIDHEGYLDFRILDGAKGTIKKEDVDSLIEVFSLTASESKGRKVYVINLVENMTPEAVNALLKFLEEPAPDTYGILTTENEARILPTIKSRCETMRLLLLPRDVVIDESVKRGVAYDDAEILSFFSNGPELIEIEKDTKEYKNAKTALGFALSGLLKRRSEALFIFENKVTPLLEGKNGARYFLDMLLLAYKDILKRQLNEKRLLSSYDTLMEPLTERIKDPAKGMRLLMNCRGEVDLNISIPLLIDHIAINLTKEF